MDTRHHLEQNLRQLRLPGILENLDIRVKEAEENSLSYMEFLAFLIQDEMDNRNHNVFLKNLRAANFGHELTLEGFDFKFNKNEIPPEVVRNLATCHFVDMKGTVIIAGPPGIGKTHLAKALGHEAVRKKYSVIFSKFSTLIRKFDAEQINGNFYRTWRKYIKPSLLILDDFALRKMTPKEAEYFYELIDERLGNGALIITSNRPPQDWLGIFPDPVVGGAILDRVVSNAHKLISQKAKSYRKEGNKKNLDE